MQGKFFGRLRVEYYNGRQWPIVNPDDAEQFGFLIRIDKEEKQIIPKDRFVTDFASIPRFLWFALPPVGDGAHARYGIAAVIHDWLYVCGKIGNEPITKNIADRVFLACMTASGVAPCKRKIMYLAVKWFGKKAWLRHAETHVNPNPSPSALQIDANHTFRKKVVLLDELLTPRNKKAPAA